MVHPYSPRYVCSWLTGLLLAVCLAVLSTGCISNPEEGTARLPPNASPTAQVQGQVPPDGETVIDLELEEEQNEEFLLVEEIIIGLLFISALVGIAAKRLRVPYTVGLVLIGLMLTFQSQADVQITPNLILALLVPPLIFEAAFHLNIEELRRNLTPILALAVPGVVITMLIVGLVVSYGTGLPLTLAFTFGALVAATDPVSVVALFRSMGVPRRLQLLLEGESLLNDGTAIVVFHIMIALVLAGTETINIGLAALEFVRVAGGGLVIGLVLGTLVSQLISRVDDHLIETTLTSVLAFSSYLIAEVSGVSGVLAVVAAGLVNGNIGPRGMSPTTRIVVFNFWEYAAFVANSFVFLLIGLRIDLAVLSTYWQSILWAIGGLLLARLVGVYGLAWLGKDIPLRWQHVLYWGGLRGAISLALALSLPAELGPLRDQVQAMTFGVVLFSLLFQGFTMEPLVKALRLIKHSETQSEYERRHARAVASREALDHLERLNRQGLISEHSWHSLSPVLREHNQTLVAAVKEAMFADPDVQAEELDTARREYLRSQRSVLSSLQKDGVISDDIYSELVAEVDAALSDPQATWPELFTSRANPSRHVKRLIAAVIQEQDLENAISSLTKLGISVTRLPSAGGFLGRRNVTLLIGLGLGQEESTIEVLSRSCRKRVEYLSTPIEGSPLPFPSPTPITVGGATIFTFDVERYEEI